MSRYAVVLKDPLAAPPAAAAFLAPREGLGRDAALNFVRKNPGFLGRDLPLEAARALAAAALKAGLGVVLAAEAALPALPPAIEAEKAEVKSDGLAVKSAAAAFFLPFDSVRVIACAAWDARVVPDTLEALRPGLFARVAELAGLARPPEPAAPLETFFRADVIGGDGPLRVSLRPERLDFSALGPDRSPASLANFRLLLDRLTAAAFGAAGNAFVPAFLAAEQLAAHKFASEEAADLSLARLLLLSAPPGA